MGLIQALQLRIGLGKLSWVAYLLLSVLLQGILILSESQYFLKEHRFE